MSGAELTTTITGDKELLRKLQQFEKRFAALAREAALAVAEEILKASQPRVPVRTGRLKRSGRVAARGSVVKIIYGADFAPHARFVHENLRAKHKNGEAKFLERPFLEAKPTIAPELARRIDLAKAVR